MAQRRESPSSNDKAELFAIDSPSRVTVHLAPFQSGGHYENQVAESADGQR
jgi:hypothetical protein